MGGLLHVRPAKEGRGSNALSLMSFSKHCTPAKIQENPTDATKTKSRLVYWESFNENLERACANTVVNDIRQNTRVGKKSSSAAVLQR